MAGVLFTVKVPEYLHQKKWNLKKEFSKFLSGKNWHICDSQFKWKIKKKEEDLKLRPYLIHFMKKKIKIEPWRIFWAGACSITSLAPSKNSGRKFSKTFRLLSISSKIPTTRYFFEILSFALSRAHLDRSEHFLSCPQKYGTTCHQGLVHSYRRLEKYSTLASVKV